MNPMMPSGSTTTPRRIPPHVLKPNKSTAYPRHCIFFDTESYQEVKANGDILHTLRLGWAVYWSTDTHDRHNEREEWYSFTTQEEFVGWLEAHVLPKSKLWCFAHNLDFDGCVTGILVTLPGRGWEMVTILSEGGAKVWRFRKDTRTLVFIDTLNYWPESLEDLGKRLGLYKGKVDFDRVTDNELSEYCRRDVEILLRTFQEYRAFLVNGDYGNFAISAAGQAFKAFTHRFMHTKIYIHSKDDVVELERKAYFGGRCECFYIGQAPKQNYYKLDVNSLYPSVMLTTPVPVKLVGHYHELSLRELSELTREYIVCAEVRLRTPEPAYPMRLRNRLVFPVGVIDTVLIGPELDYALEHEHILEVKQAAFYNAEVVFDNYVRYWYAKRLEYEQAGNPLYAHFCKMLLNSLYGKFGQRNDEWVDVDAAEPDEIRFCTVLMQDGSAISERTIAGKRQWRVRGGNSYNSFVAIAATVTAAARMRLWYLLNLAGLDNVYYCDTDSLFVNQEGFDNLGAEISTTRELGKLKLEDTTDTLVINSPKNYVWGSTSRTKGISKLARSVGKDTWLDYYWLSLRGMVREGNLLSYVVHPIYKRLDGVYSKGIVTDSGRVIPLALAPLEDALSQSAL